MFTRIERAVTAGGIAVCVFAVGLWGQSTARGSVDQPAADAVRVLIISGQGGHDWRSTTPFLRKVLANTGRFDVRVCEAPAGITAQSLEDFDVLVDDYAGPALGSDTEKAIVRFVKSGNGLVITRGAIGSFIGPRQADRGKQRPAPVFARLVPAYWTTVPDGDRQTAVPFINVKITRPEHPIVHGLKSGFKTADAVYRGMTVLSGAEVLATAARDATIGAGKDAPVLLTAEFGDGRVFCTGLGNDLAAMQEKVFIATFARGTEWAATGTVTLPAEAGLARPNADAVRALLITGGHDHETVVLLALRRLQRPGLAAGGRQHHGLSERPARQVRRRDHVRLLPRPGREGQEKPPRLRRERQGRRGPASRSAQLPEVDLVVSRMWSAAAIACRGRGTFRRRPSRMTRRFS